MRCYMMKSDEEQAAEAEMERVHILAQQEAVVERKKAKKNATKRVEEMNQRIIENGHILAQQKATAEKAA